SPVTAIAISERLIPAASVQYSIAARTGSSYHSACPCLTRLRRSLSIATLTSSPRISATEKSCDDPPTPITHSSFINAVPNLEGLSCISLASRKQCGYCQVSCHSGVMSAWRPDARFNASREIMRGGVAEIHWLTWVNRTESLRVNIKDCPA